MKLRGLGSFLMVVAYIVLLLHMRYIPSIDALIHPDLNRSQPPLFIWVRHPVIDPLSFFLANG